MKEMEVFAIRNIIFLLFFEPVRLGLFLISFSVGWDFFGGFHVSSSWMILCFTAIFLLSPFVTYYLEVKEYPGEALVFSVIMGVFSALFYDLGHFVLLIVSFFVVKVVLGIIVEIVRKVKNKYHAKKVCKIADNSQKIAELKNTGDSLDEIILEINEMLKGMKEQESSSLYIEKVESVYFPRINRLLDEYICQRGRQTEKSKDIQKQIEDILLDCKKMLEEYSDSCLGAHDMETLAEIEALKTKMEMEQRGNLSPASN